jgi:hypothetical protein
MMIDAEFGRMTTVQSHTIAIGRRLKQLDVRTGL